MAEKFSNFCCKAVRGIGIFLTGYLFLQGLFTICCIQRVTETTYYVKNNPFPQLAGIGVFLLLTLLLGQKAVGCFLEKHGKKLVLAALAVMAVFLVYWVIHTCFWYNADIELIFLHAEAMLKGDYSGWWPEGYMHMCPHQNGLLLFVALLLKFFSVGESFYAFYGVNIIFYIITILALYKTLQLLFPDKKINCIQMLMMIAYLPYAFYCMMLYGNIIGMGFAVVSILLLLLYLKSRRLYYLLFSALSMVFAISFKQNEMIILVGLLILLFFDWIRCREKRGRAVALVVVYLAIVLMGIRLPNLLVEQITGMEVSGGESKLAYVTMGLQSGDKELGAPGWYNAYHHELFREHHYDTEATSQAALADLKEQLRAFAENPAAAWSFFNRKIASEWNNPTFECFNIQNARNTSLELNSLVKSTINDGGKINIILIFLLDIGQSVLLFGIFLYFLSADKADLRQLLFCILFIGGFLFFAFWEAKCQYVVPFFFLLIPYAYPGYRELAQRLTGRVKWNKLYTGLAVLAVLAVVIAVSNGQWVQNSFKIHKDTEAYYEYIHEYNQNFVNFRF